MIPPPAWLPLRYRALDAKARILAALENRGQAAILLAGRDADHLTNLVYDAKAIPAEELEADLQATRDHMEPIPEYAFDCHTMKGKMAGKTKTDFFRAEHQALEPFIPGLFDNYVPEEPRKN